MKPALLPDYQRCMYTTRDGKRCRNGRMTESVDLCYFHWNAREQQARREAARAERAAKQTSVARKLFPHGDRLDTPQAVSRFISRIARALADGEIEPRVGTSLGYLGQVALSTLAHHERVRAAEEAAKAKLPPENPLLEYGEATRIDAILKSIQQHTDPNAPPLPDSATPPEAA